MPIRWFGWSRHWGVFTEDHHDEYDRQNH